MHHRGQLMLVERMLGIVPHLTREREARCRGLAKWLGIEPLLENTWGDTAKAIVNNWLGLVYQTTNLDRCKQYMDGVDPNDPLGLKN